MEWTFDIHIKLRALFEEVLQRYSVEQLNKIPEGFNNNIIWHIGHVIATQQILVYQFSDCKALVSDAFINSYRKGTAPERTAFPDQMDHIKDLLLKTSYQKKQIT